jgi:hypothetical protein
MDALFSNTQNIAATLDIVVVLVGAIAAGWYAFFGAKKNQQASDNAVSQNLIQNLQTSLDLTKSDLRDTNTKLEATTADLHRMQGRNSVLEGLFNGNEGSIVSTLKLVPELVAAIKEANSVSKANADSVGKMAAGITDLVTALREAKPAPQLDVTSMRS